MSNVLFHTKKKKKRVLRTPLKRKLRHCSLILGVITCKDRLFEIKHCPLFGSYIHFDHRGTCSKA